MLTELAADYFVQMPFVRQALKDVRSCIYEANAGTGHKILYRLRNEHRAGRCQRANPRCDMQRNPVEFATPNAAFARMESNTASYADCSQGFHDRHSALDRARWAIERCQEPIAHGVHLLAAKSCELAADRCMMRL